MTAGVAVFTVVGAFAAAFVGAALPAILETAALVTGAELGALAAAAAAVEHTIQGII